VILSDRSIRQRLARRQLVIEPYEPSHLQPASIDVRLDRHFRPFRATGEPIDPAVDQAHRTDELITLPDGEPCVLHPDGFVLASTYERVSLPADLAARVEGKSSLGRLGLVVHTTAGFVDPGFRGYITLELKNLNVDPILLWPGMKIGQLCLFRLDSRAERPYGSRAAGSHYQDQTGPTPSRAHERFTRW
jgi:dCTP deaminase